MGVTTGAPPVGTPAAAPAEAQDRPVRALPAWAGRGLAALWVLCVAALAAPRPILAIPGWVDGSWQVAVGGLVRRAGLHWGSGVVFTYGPAGFLDIPVPYFAPEWLAAVAAALAVEVALAACVALLLALGRAPWWQWVLCGICVVFALHVVPAVESAGPVLVVLLLWSAAVAADTGRSGASLWLCAAGGAAGGVLALVKGSGAVAVVLILAVFAVAMLRRRRWWHAAGSLAAFVAVLAAVWFGSGQRFGDALPYLHAAWETVRGYAAAQWYEGVTLGIVAGSVLLAALLATGVWLAWRRRRAALLVLMSCAVLLVQFKDSFVREGPERDVTFFAVAALLALPAMVEGWNRPTRFRFAAVRRLRVAAPLALIVCGLTWTFAVAPGSALRWPDAQGYRTAFRALRSAAEREALQRTSRADALDGYAAMYPGIVDDAGGRSIDVYPWDIGVVYAHPELRWTPRPVLASYQAYTPWLDGRDAAFLDAPDAPQLVLYRFAAQNGQYPPFDEPAYFRELLARYRAVAPIGDNAVLMARTDSPSPLGPPRDEGTRCAAFGTEVAIPQHQGRWTFAAVQVHSAAAGAVAAAIWKPAGIDVHLRGGGDIVSYRLSPGTAGDGLYLSTLLRSASDVIAAQRGEGDAPATISLTTTAPWEYGGQVCLAFSSVPRP